MTREELLKLYAEAIVRDQNAREALDAAHQAADLAAKEMWAARESLREHEKAEVAAALKLVA